MLGAILRRFGCREGFKVGWGVSQVLGAFCTTLPDGQIRWAERSVRVRCLSSLTETRNTRGEGSMRPRFRLLLSIVLFWLATVLTCNAQTVTTNAEFDLGGLGLQAGEI